MYWAAFFAAISLVSASSVAEQTEQTIPSRSLCNGEKDCKEVSGLHDIDDYTSVLQVSLSVDKTRGYKPTDADQEASPAGVDSITPNPEAQVEQATLDETMVVLGKAGDASFHRLRSSLPYIHQSVTGLWKRLQKEPPYSNAFDFAIGLFVLASVTTSFLACTLLALRGHVSGKGRPRRCSAWRALFKVKPEEITRVAKPLPEFHPAKQHCLQSSGFPRPQYKDMPATENSKQAAKQPQQPRACSHYVPQSAEQILQEAERQAAQAAAACEAEGPVLLTEYKKMNKDFNPPRDSLPTTPQDVRRPDAVPPELEVS